MKITEGSSVRSIPFLFSSKYISKFYIGENIDFSTKQTGASSSTGFCDYQDSPSLIQYEYSLIRSGNANSGFSGISYLNVTLTESNSSSDVSTRIAFRGEIVIES